MNISPKQFLKTRRPEQFSDSRLINESRIDSTLLGYYLETLSSRSQEVEFERFAIRLCKASITPNLMPNTGPTGGGDGKVDSETYPVSKETALGWYTCIDPESANERWGFAISIQKTWGSKIRDDVKKAYETGRNYKVIYFVSSRIIRAKDKARVQDELKEKYKIDVRILDRDWILKDVFENKHQNIAKEELHTEKVSEEKTKTGPLDFKKEETLQKLDKDIEKSIAENKCDSTVVDEAIKSAILSRELEKPRFEIDGRFDRADRLAKEYGSTYQQFEVAYQFAWTTFWWHEDFKKYVELYDNVETQAISTDHVYNLERLTNLWYGLNNLRNQDKKYIDIIPDDFYNKHTKTLKNKLKEISVREEDKPSDSLYAKSLFLQIELSEKRFTGENINQTLIDLTKVVNESESFIGFPFKSLVNILTEISPMLEDSPSYKGLFDAILKTTEKRDGELASAKLLLDRGEKLLSLDRPYEAIQGLGVTLNKLYKYESKDHAIRALYAISIGYEQVGLFWAARGSLLTAASLATSDFWKYGNINTMQALCYKRLKWLELRIGRLPQTLDWQLLDIATHNILSSKGFNIENYIEDLNRFDLSLGILFLRSDLKTLKNLEKLVDSLYECGLEFSPIALIYALGQEEKIPQDFKDAISPTSLDDFFNQWGGQYSEKHLPKYFTNTEDTITQLTSNVLGCKIVINTENQSPCLEVAESLISAIESFLSTGTLRHAASFESTIEIKIDSLAGKELIEFNVEEADDKPIINVHCKNFNPHSVSLTDQKKLQDLIFNLLVNSVVRFVMFKDQKQDLKDIMQKERASERALSFSSSFVVLGNVLGHKPKTRISEWIKNKSQRYELIRTESLFFAETPQEKPEVSENSPEDDPLLQAKHSDMQTISIIRNVLWDQAKWKGAGYMVMPNGEQPPILAILFEDFGAGKKIFTGWKKKFSAEDKDEEIRITILTGIDKDNPLHYKVGIGSSFKALEKEKEKNNSRFFTASTRIHVMTPASLENLDRFKKSFAQFGVYLFTIGALGNPPDIVIDHGIVKREIYFKEAWEIGPGDLDAPLISPDDNPIIPPHIKNPPILDLFKSRESSSPRKLES